MSEIWETLLTDEELEVESSVRKKIFIEKKVSWDEVEDLEQKGWSIKKQYKNGSAVMITKKDAQTSLVDKLWSIFYRMGFSMMNGSNFSVKIDMPYFSGEKKIDIVAMDEETCLFIDCFAAEQFDRARSFTTELQNISKIQGLLSSQVREWIGDRKCKYIFATSNYLIQDKELEYMNEKRIAYFDEESVDYYLALVDHLGSAARFQLLGNLFSKTTIRGMDERVPAIEGKMGNMTYYSFLIEPERLLKIGYVLHRNKANHEQMPTYQRLIKKDRLKSIREYVNNGGFFPNSLIISIDCKSGSLRFDRATQNLQGAHSKVGTLYLPKEYQSAYIIDGQHRLYGYSDSKYASTDTLPVIAFVNMDKEKQVKMFMDINENQKPVSKTLRNILNIDLNWSSDNLIKRKEAVILSISQALGENPNSPLFGRILTGEDSITEKRCITIEYIKAALEKTIFFNKYNKKNEVIERGLLDRIESEATFKLVYSYIRNCLQVIADLCTEEWEKGSAGFLTINNTMVGIIRVISDITNITLNANNFDINQIDINELYQASANYLLNFAEVINTLSQEKRNELKTAKGGSAKEVSWRLLQVALNAYDPSFINPELEKYIDENCTDYNTEGLELVLSIKEHLVTAFRDCITQKLDWENTHIAEDLSIKLNQKVTAQNVKNSRSGVNTVVTFWDVIEFDDLCKIMNYKANWSTMLKDIFAINGIPRSRAEVITLLKSIQSSEQRISNGKQITKTEFLLIEKFYGDIKGA